MALKLLECISWNYEPDEYKIDGNGSLIITVYNISPYSESAYYVNPLTNNSFVCIPDSAKPPFYYVDLFFVCLWSISIISLFTSIAIKFKHMKINQRHVLFHQIFLIIFYGSSTVFTVIQSNSDAIFWISLYVGYFAIVSALCWLTVINFEMWNKFQPKKNQSEILQNPSFFLQSLFALGVPTIIIVVSTIWRYFRVHEPFNRQLYRFSDPEATFSNITTTIVVTINCALFFFTIRNLHRSGNVIVSANARIHKKLRFVYLKLMVVTGIVWFVQLLEWILAPYTNNWFLVNIIVSLQGFFLFLVYHSNLFKYRSVNCPVIFLIRVSSRTTSVSYL